MSIASNLSEQRAAVDGWRIAVLPDLSEALSRRDRRLKRIFDLVLASLFLLIFWPAMLLIALGIKLDSAGPVLFRQRRVGEGGRLFWMYKFRSMVNGAERQEIRLLQTTTDGRPVFAKSPQDERVTRIGRLLRRTSLDELPQLFNVLKGDMSLVGPRPELPGVIEMYRAWHLQRFAVPQGMTGWWQVRGRMSRADLQERAEDDLYYIRNYSLWLDLLILWKTVGAVIRGEGAY